LLHKVLDQTPAFLFKVQTGLAWMTKILTDPFHDILLYC
jgi:hypothetical protein